MFLKNATAWAGTIRKSVFDKHALGMISEIITDCTEGLLLSPCHHLSQVKQPRHGKAKWVACPKQVRGQSRHTSPRGSQGTSQKLAWLRMASALERTDLSVLLCFLRRPP